MKTIKYKGKIVDLNDIEVASVDYGYPFKKWAYRKNR